MNSNENVRNVAANRLKYIPNNVNGLFMWPNREVRRKKGDEKSECDANGLQHAI